jgi:DNA-binding MarR family transcriptional regulator
MMDQDTQVRTDFRFEGLGTAVHGAATWPDAGDAGAAPARLLFVGPRDCAPDIDRVGDVRLVAAISAPRAADHVRRMGAIDMIWLTAAEMIESEMLADLCAAAAERGCSLICETTLAALDRVAAVIPESLRTEYLVDADATERLMALVAVRRTPRMTVHDIARGDAMERIDQLQEEVARISRLLGDLAGQRGLGGTPAGFAPRGDDFADYPGQVRSPPRDYANMPRSFVPEDRTIDRQRAKAVRRVLRQRRMREQYFPADLFADPAWDMLLDLYAARLERQPVSVSSLCIAAAVPATTALRWIKTMTDAGLFVREADPHDGRRIFIALAEGACDALARYFEALEE